MIHDNEGHSIILLSLVPIGSGKFFNSGDEKRAGHWKENCYNNELSTISAGYIIGSTTNISTSTRLGVGTYSSLSCKVFLKHFKNKMVAPKRNIWRAQGIDCTTVPSCHSLDGPKVSKNLL